MPISSSGWLPTSLRTASLIAGELHRAGVAVDQRDAVEEEAGGEGAEQEVLERRLLAEQPAAAGQAAEQVERQREHLERHEHGEQVVGGREQHHPADREHQQRVDLGVVEAAGRRLALGLGARQRRGLAGERRHPALEVPLGEQQHAADGEEQDQAPQEQGRAVDRDRALGGDQAAGRAVAERPSRSAATMTDADERRRPGRPGRARSGRGSAAARGRNASTSTPTHATPKTSEQRPQLGVLDGRLDELDHCWPSSAESCPAGHGGRVVGHADLLERGRRRSG